MLPRLKLPRPACAPALEAAPEAGADNGEIAPLTATAPPFTSAYAMAGTAMTSAPAMACSE